MKLAGLAEQYGPIVLGGLIERAERQAATMFEAKLGPEPEQDPTVRLLKDHGSEVLQVLTGIAREQDLNRVNSKVAFIADLASRFCHGGLELGDDERELARRAVRLATFIVGEATLAVEKEQGS